MLIDIKILIICIGILSYFIFLLAGQLFLNKNKFKLSFMYSMRMLIPSFLASFGVGIALADVYDRAALLGFTWFMILIVGTLFTYKLEFYEDFTSI